MTQHLKNNKLNHGKKSQRTHTKNLDNLGWHAVATNEPAMRRASPCVAVFGQRAYIVGALSFLIQIPISLDLAMAMNLSLWHHVSETRRTRTRGPRSQASGAGFVIVEPG